MRFGLEVPEELPLRDVYPAVSRDGRQVALVPSDPAAARVWVRSLGARHARAIHKIDVAWSPSAKIAQAGLAIVEADGRTPVPSLVKRHVDVPGLDLVRLGKVAKLFARAVREKRYLRLTRRGVVELIRKAEDDRLLELRDLSESVRESVLKARSE
jgi:hypothetical protein